MIVVDASGPTCLPVDRDVMSRLEGARARLAGIVAVVGARIRSLPDTLGLRNVLVGGASTAVLTGAAAWGATLLVRTRAADGDVEAWSFWGFLATSWSLFLALWVLVITVSAAGAVIWMLRQVRSAVTRGPWAQILARRGESPWFVARGGEVEHWDVRDRPTPLEPGVHLLRGSGGRELYVKLEAGQMVRSASLLTYESESEIVMRVRSGTVPLRRLLRELA